MNKKLTNDQSKIDLVARLVKEGHIDLMEALFLIEVETVTEFVNVPYVEPTRYGPPLYKDPYNPFSWQSPITVSYNDAISHSAGTTLTDGAEHSVMNKTTARLFSKTPTSLQ